MFLFMAGGQITKMNKQEITYMRTIMGACILLLIGSVISIIGIDNRLDNQLEVIDSQLDVIQNHFLESSNYNITYANITFIPSPETIEDKISLIAENVSDSHDYIKEVYDCTQFSQELAKRLRNELGLNAYCVGTIYINNSGSWLRHTWVEVKINNTIIPVEATKGYIIPSDVYSSQYKIFETGSCE